MEDFPMREEGIKVEQHGQFFVVGDVEHAEVVVVALHGYGQLARFFGRIFHQYQARWYWYFRRVCIGFTSTEAVAGLEPPG